MKKNLHITRPLTSSRFHLNAVCRERERACIQYSNVPCLITLKPRGCMTHVIIDMHAQRQREREGESVVYSC